MNTAEAIRQRTEALRLDVGNASLACDLADALLEAGYCGKAIAVFQHALEYEPRLARAWYGGGCAENERGNFAAAREWFARAVELVPEWLEARHNLARALYELGLVTDAFAEFQKCAEMNLPGSEQSRAMMAVIVPGVPHATQAEILATRSEWALRDLGEHSEKQKRPRHYGPLRVGYVSSFFHRDNWMKPVWGLINRHNRKSIRVYLFSDSPASSAQHGYQPNGEDQLIETSRLSNHELSRLVDESEIDVLVDLNGYSNMRRLPLFALPLAPVTLAWFNMYATSGMKGFDFLIGDEHVVPFGEEQFYTEKIWRVPGSYLTFDVNYPVPPVTLKRQGPFLFGALASQYKITDKVIAAWSRILAQSPGSRLLVKNNHLESSAAREFLLLRFASFGIAAHRLQLEGPEDHFEFLKAYERMDVALDTFPYNGGTTTTEAIWQGVPVVTFYGDRWASRTSASILRAGGLSEFVAADVNDYVNLAVSLANNAATRDRLEHLRGEMRTRLQASSVCDTRSFAGYMEALYLQSTGQ